jgi:hypothetical protein
VTGMKVKYIIGAGLLITLSFAAWALYLYNKPHQDTSRLRPAFRMDAADLFKAYTHDEAAANRSYVDKVIEVMGTISDEAVTDSTFSLLLNTGDALGAVNCSFQSTGYAKHKLPPKGAPVVIKGRCTGFLTDVNMVDCVME